MILRQSHRARFATALMGSVALPLSALAQEADAPSASAQGLEEIIVTAQRRQQSAQDIPISITAFSERQIETKQIRDVTAMVGLTPGVSMQQAYNPFDIRIQIRGVSLTIPALGVDPPVGVYVDGVYYAITGGSNAGFIDMERAEVLKGPQGTLFGRNTIGGALNITTKKPTDEFEGSVEGALGNYKLREATAILNAPIVSGKIAARFVYQHSQHSGYGHNELLDSPLSDLNQDYFRGSLKITPSDDWEILLSGSYMDADSHASPIKLAYLDPTHPVLSNLPYANQLPQYVGGNPYRTYGAINPPNKNRVWGGNATITGHLGDVTLKSISSFSRTEQDTAADQSGTPFPLIQVRHYIVEVDQLAQELQAYGDAFDGRLNWIGGLYYFHDYGDERYNSVLAQPLLPPQVVTSHHIKNSSYAAFAQLTYRLTDSLRLTGGLRWSRDTREIDYYDYIGGPDGSFIVCRLANAPGNPSQDACQINYKAAFSYLPWTVSLEYTPDDDLLVYAKVSQGFRSGGFGLSGPAPGATPSDTAAAIANGGAFEPEKLISPELGFKYQSPDRRLRLNAAIYYSRYSHIQQSTNIAAPGGGVLSVTRNVGTADIYGGEIDAELLLGKLRLNGGLAITRPKFVAGPKEGTPVLNTPKTSWTFGAELPVELSAGTVTANVDYTWRSKVYFFEPDPTNPARTAADTQEGYGLLNGQISFEPKDVPVTISLWGRNLANKRYRVETADLVASFGFASEFAGIPRTYGVRVRYRF